MDCPYNDCVNRDVRCHVCVPIGRLHKIKKRPKRVPKKRNSMGKVMKYQKEGMEFQDRVAKKFNEFMSAAVVPNSGAMWFKPGDIVSEEFLMECKERGTISSSGEKQITITKSMLDKIKQEAGANRAPVLPFGFKGSPEIYVACEFDILLELIRENRLLRSIIEVAREDKDEDR